MRVSIDQRLCTSSGLCEVIDPDVFVLRDDGLAYVRDEGATGQIEPMTKYDVLPGHEQAVGEAAEQCPGECIYIEE